MVIPAEEMIDLLFQKNHRAGDVRGVEKMSRRGSPGSRVYNAVGLADSCITIYLFCSCLSGHLRQQGLRQPAWVQFHVGDSF